MLDTGEHFISNNIRARVRSGISLDYSRRIVHEIQNRMNGARAADHRHVGQRDRLDSGRLGRSGERLEALLNTGTDRLGEKKRGSVKVAAPLIRRRLRPWTPGSPTPVVHAP